MPAEPIADFGVKADGKLPVEDTGRSASVPARTKKPRRGPVDTADVMQQIAA